jgi:hypothetical protein
MAEKSALLDKNLLECFFRHPAIDKILYFLPDVPPFPLFRFYFFGCFLLVEIDF